MTKESIVEDIREIINNESCRETAQEMTNILASKPVPAKELFLKNVEFAMKFDLNSSHVTLYGAKLTFIQYYNLDLFLIAFAIILTVIYLFYRFIKLIVCCFVRSKRPKQNKYYFHVLCDIEIPHKLHSKYNRGYLSKNKTQNPMCDTLLHKGAFLFFKFPGAFACVVFSCEIRVIHNSHGLG